MSAHRNGERQIADQERFDRLAATLARRPGWAATGFAAVFVTGLAATMLPPAEHESTATLLLAPAARADHAAGPLPDSTGTIAAELRSRAAAAAIIEALALTQDRLDRAEDWRGGLADRVAALRDRITAPDPHAEDALRAAVAARIRVAPEPDSDILRVGFRAADPALAQQAAQALVQAFLRSRTPDEAAASRDAAALHDLRDRAAAATAALDRFRAEAGDAAALRRDPLVQAIARLDGDLAQAEAQRQQFDATAQTLRERLRGWVPFRPGVVRSLNEAEVALAGAAAQVAALRAALAERRAELAALAPLDDRRRALEAAAAAAQDRLAAQTAAIQATRAAEAAAAAERRAIRVLDPADYPTAPIGPARWPGLLASLLGGLLAMLALPALVQRLRPDARAMEAETARRLGLTFVTTVPRVRDWSGWSGADTLPATGSGADAR